MPRTDSPAQRSALGKGKYFGRVILALCADRLSRSSVYASFDNLLWSQPTTMGPEHTPHAVRGRPRRNTILTWHNTILYLRSSPTPPSPLLAPVALVLVAAGFIAERSRTPRCDWEAVMHDR